MLIKLNGTKNILNYLKITDLCTNLSSHALSPIFCTMYWLIINRFKYSILPWRMGAMAQRWEWDRNNAMWARAMRCNTQKDKEGDRTIETVPPLTLSTTWAKGPASENLRRQSQSQSQSCTSTPINVTFLQRLANLPHKQINLEVLTSLGFTPEVPPQYICDRMEPLGPI